MHRRVLPATAEGCGPQYMGLSGALLGRRGCHKCCTPPCSTRRTAPHWINLLSWKWSCGNTGGNSHLAGFKTKVQSQLLYYQSGNGYNIKFFSFKKKIKKKAKSHSPFFPPHTFIWWKIWYKTELCTLENLARVSVQYKKEWRTKSQDPMLMMTLKGA